MGRVKRWTVSAAVLGAIVLVLYVVLAVDGTRTSSRGADERPPAHTVGPAARTPVGRPHHARPRWRRIWVGAAALRRQPTSGPAWERLLTDAESDPGPANVADQDSGHDVLTLAAALVCARTQAAEFCTKARYGLVSAIGTERGARWLAVGRNLTAYVIAADVLGLRADRFPTSTGSRVESWIRGFLTKRLADDHTGQPVPLIPFDSGSNASAEEGAVYTAVAAYLHDRAALDRAWDAFRTFTCAPDAPDREHIDLHRGVEYGWAHDDKHPCAINPAGTTKPIPPGRNGAGEAPRIDGAIINDMLRGGDYQWPPGVTQYPWVGLQGLVPAAVILHRAGYPSFAVADRAVLRAVDYLWYLQNATQQGEWFQERQSSEIVQLVNVAYGTQFPLEGPVGFGRTVGYTDWTHPTSVG
jgi:hypothetical protein